MGHASALIQAGGLNILTDPVLGIGDSGFNERMYSAIGERAGPFDIALIPIGSYLPRSHMAAVHVAPPRR